MDQQDGKINRTQFIKLYAESVGSAPDLALQEGKADPFTVDLASQVFDDTSTHSPDNLVLRLESEIAALTRCVALIKHRYAITQTSVKSVADARSILSAQFVTEEAFSAAEALILRGTTENLRALYATIKASGPVGAQQRFLQALCDRQDEQPQVGVRKTPKIAAAANFSSL